MHSPALNGPPDTVDISTTTTVTATTTFTTAAAAAATISDPGDGGVSSCVTASAAIAGAKAEGAARPDADARYRGPSSEFSGLVRRLRRCCLNIDILLRPRHHDTSTQRESHGHRFVFPLDL